MGEVVQCRQNGRTLSYVYSDRSLFHTHRIIMKQEGCNFADYFLLLLVCMMMVIIIGRGAEALYPLPFFLGFLVYHAKGRRVVQEAVVVIPTLGVQLETVYQSKKVHRQFVPLENIVAPLINEAVTPVTCYFYLALMLRDEDALVLTFLHLRPPLKMLVPIWKSLCNAAGITHAKPSSHGQDPETDEG